VSLSVPLTCRPNCPARRAARGPVPGGHSSKELQRTQHAPRLTGPAPRAQYDNQLLQLFTSSLFIAGLLSSLVASWTTSRLGRRATMLMAGVAFCLGAGLTAGAVHLAMLVVGRIMLGVGVGFANQARARAPSRREPLAL